jgi:hypothetical protein
VHFKTAVQTFPRGGTRTVSRSIGWTDGMQEFIVEVDEKTGKREKDPYAVPLRPGHLHPQSKLLPGSQRAVVIN